MAGHNFVTRDAVTKHKIVYLACPYTHPDKIVREQRFQAATAAAVRLIKTGRIVFSPITMTHPLDLLLGGGETMGSDYWVNFDEAFMDACSEMIILTIEGWQESDGIGREIEHFQRQGKPVGFIDPEG